MQLNTNKTKVLHISRSKKPANLPQYILQGVPLSVTSIFKYLGVTINNTLTWNDHVNAVVSKANMTLGFMWQIAGGSSTKVLTSLYKSLYQYLSTGCQLGPHTSASISKLQRVQRRASRMCLKQRKGTMTYEDRLHALNWISLDSETKTYIDIHNKMSIILV